LNQAQGTVGLVWTGCRAKDDRFNTARISGTSVKNAQNPFKRTSVLPTDGWDFCASFWAMDHGAHVEKLLRCRKCYRTGTATWEATQIGVRALLALSEGFHRRTRIPLSLPPEIVCDCGTVLADYD
jgi:hypothetical protein